MRARFEQGRTSDRGCLASVSCSGGWLHCAQAKSLGFHLKVGFGVDVGGVDRDMAEPCADGVDVDAGAKKMRCGGVADGVRADRFLRISGTAVAAVRRISRHDVVDAEACQRLRATIQEHAFFGVPRRRRRFAVQRWWRPRADRCEPYRLCREDDTEDNVPSAPLCRLRSSMH